MRTVAQAATVAKLTGGVHLVGKPGTDGPARLSRQVDVGTDFEVHRNAVQSVSVLFSLFAGDAASYAINGQPGEQLPTGWMVTAAKFEVDWPTDPARARLVRSHFGARRKAYNWGLARVKADLDARKTDPDHVSVSWTLAGLRKQWNREKDNVARHVAGGRAQILNMTLSRRWGRLFVSVTYALRTPRTPPAVAHPAVRVGVGLGLRQLATIASVDLITGEEAVTVVANPAPLRHTLAARRRPGRQLSRRIPGSRGFRSAKAKLTRLDRRCVHLRREAAHQLTTSLAAQTTRNGTALTVADRWYPSSQLHHGCTTPDGQPCRLIGKTRLDKQLVCPITGVQVDRDTNAALNLRDWPDLPVEAQLVPRPRSSAPPAVVSGTAAQTTTLSGRLRSTQKTISHSGMAVCSEARTDTRHRVDELRKEST